MSVGGVTVRMSTDPSVSGAATAPEFDAAELAELTGGLSADQVRQALEHAAAVASASPTPGDWSGPAPTGPLGPVTSLATSVMVDMYVPLDGAAILAMTGRSLRALDGSIRQRMASVTHRTEVSNELTSQLESLNEIRGQMEGEDKVNPDEIFLADGSTAREYLESIGQPVVGKKLQIEELDATSGIVNQQLAQVSSGSELVMIQLQQDVARRAQILTLGTNLMSKLNQTLAQISNNVGGR